MPRNFKKSFLAQEMKQTGYWLYDLEKGTIFNRTPEDCAICMGFYVMFYIGLGVFCGVCWLFEFNFLIYTWHADNPMYHGSDGFLQTPGLSFVPMVNGSRLVYYYRNGPTKDVLKEEIDKFLLAYDKSMWPSNEVEDCRPFYNLAEKPLGLDGFCTFLEDDLDPSCNKANDYGYDDSQPCIYFKVNKIIGWKPRNYVNASYVPAEILDVWEPNMLTLTCEGADASSRENMGEVTYSPQQGFPYVFFPYPKRTIEFIQPLVSVSFENVRTHVLIFVECRIWAENINHSRGEGIITFQLLIE